MSEASHSLSHPVTLVGDPTSALAMVRYFLDWNFTFVISLFSILCQFAMKSVKFFNVFFSSFTAYITHESGSASGFLSENEKHRVTIPHLALFIES